MAFPMPKSSGVVGDSVIPLSELWPKTSESDGQIMVNHEVFEMAMP